ncbi:MULTISPECIES: hypothetical protein [Halomonas]|uniref:hypothetical protein n=1 Tax=Halomonas TaxID=2745 RepID=UPI0015F11925|nr:MULTISPECIES: hypothetical protein [Halomonas]MCE9684064.1 hypothetical protein [Halomonas alkalisoli]
MTIPQQTAQSRRRPSLMTVLKLFIPSALGILIFFVPVTIGERTTIMCASKALPGRG